MRTILVCVRTSLAAQNVAAVAARLGLSGAVQTAVSDPEVMLRLAERPADVVLADTALTRPDTVGFTRRVLARSPGATILLIGLEEPGVAGAAISAGARGVIRGVDRDLTSVVAKAILLLAAPRRAASRAAVPPAKGPSESAAGTETGGPVEGTEQPTVVPVQRGDDVTAGDPPAEPRRPGEARPSAGPRDNPGRSPSMPPAGAFLPGGPDPRVNAATELRFGTARRGDPVNSGGYGRPVPAAAGPVRRIALTEREMQVLVGMADGKSNAEIGRDLFVSEDTVKTHARRLFRKLGARDRAHAVAAGFRAGLVA